MVFAALFALGPGLASAIQVEFVLSEDAGAYVEAASAVRRELSGNVAVVQATAADLERGDAAPNVALAVTFGARAFKAALSERTAPILATLITRQAFEETLGGGVKAPDARPVSAVYLDQPFSRHLDLVRAALPGRSRLGMLVSPGEADSVRALSAAAQAQKLTLVSEVVALPREIYPALTRLLARCDAVVATPDPRIFNGATLHNILLATYREARPLLGFSPAYVRAGALAAVYSTPQQIAPQVASVVQRVLSGSGLPPAQYPQAFSVKVNATVARSLGISVGDERTVEARLQALERDR